MPKKANIWRPIIFANDAGHPERGAPVLPIPTGPPNPRVLTSRQVKRAYRARGAINSTPTGVYVLTGGPSRVPDGQQSGDPTQPGPSTLRETSDLDPSLSSRDSSPLNDASGWASDFPPSPQPTSNPAHSRNTRANQYTKWTKIVIPQLVQPYLELIRRSDSLGSVDRQFSSLCVCGQVKARELKVTCIYFDCEFSFSMIPQYQY